MEGFDLTRFQQKGEEQDKIKKIMGKILSGRNDYEAILEEKTDIRRCQKCNWGLEGGEKFCPECGTKA
ncbi:MAG: hypothetical protein NUV97_02050 [archaeon]|nr:hypothetical protein [archaeon]MCR4323734.1 hypothetical protein [Nanoarchaeota archaeon]